MNILTRLFKRSGLKPGVYRIRNTANQVEYIGATTLCFELRWRQHINSLRSKRHSNRRLQEDWNRHGEAAFQFEIIEIVHDADKVFARERYWQDLNYNRDKRYNPSNIPPPRDEDQELVSMLENYGYLCLSPQEQDTARGLIYQTECRAYFKPEAQRSKSSAIEEATGVKRGGSAAYKRFSTIYDALIGQPPPAVEKSTHGEAVRA